MSNINVAVEISIHSIGGDECAGVDGPILVVRNTAPAYLVELEFPGGVKYGLDAEDLAEAIERTRP